MPYVDIEGTNTSYALMCFDKHGREATKDPDASGGLFSSAVLDQVRREKPSHLFFFSHGWKGDVDAAVDQYNRWIKAMLDLKQDVAVMGNDFRPLWIGLHWPSLPWGDEELEGKSFDMDPDAPLGMGLDPEVLVADYLDRLGLDESARPLLEVIVGAQRRDAAATELPPDAEAAYADLARQLGHHAVGPEGPPDADGTAFDPQASFEAGNAAAVGTDFGSGGLLGGILGPLRQLSYWTMKKRARSIGESGLHDLVAELQKAAPGTRLHLMGHSFGCIVVSSILGGPGGRSPLPRAVDSVALVQGAVSLWAFADCIPATAGKGYFNAWLRRGAVRGPVVCTRSIHDRAVGMMYPLASAASLADPSFDVDAEDIDLPRYGAIGAYGMRGVSDASLQPMLPQTGIYGFKPGQVCSLEASQYIRKGGGISGAHSDIDGPDVAHAIWQAAII